MPNNFFKASDNTQATRRPQQVVVSVAVEHCAKQMSKSKENILAQKEFLAAEALKVANESLGYIQDALPECSVRDLVYDRAAGDFDVEFRYQSIVWTTGNFNGGVNGLGGTPAQIGFNAGDNVTMGLHCRVKNRHQVPNRRFWKSILDIAE